MLWFIFFHREYTKNSGFSFMLSIELLNSLPEFFAHSESQPFMWFIPRSTNTGLEINWNESLTEREKHLEQRFANWAQMRGEILTYRNLICSRVWCLLYNRFVWGVFGKQCTEGKTHAMSGPSLAWYTGQRSDAGIRYTSLTGSSHSSRRSLYCCCCH